VLQTTGADASAAAPPAPLLDEDAPPAPPAPPPLALVLLLVVVLLEVVLLELVLLEPLAPPLLDVALELVPSGWVVGVSSQAKASHGAASAIRTVRKR